MPCFSEVTPVVETDHAGSWEARGFQSPPRSKEYRTYKTIRLFLFWTKENRWNNRSPVIQRKWAFSAFILSTVWTARRERKCKQLNVFQHPAGVNSHLIYALVIGPGLPVCLGLIFWLFVQNPQELVVVLIDPWYKCFQSTCTESLCILSTFHLKSQEGKVTLWKIEPPGITTIFLLLLYYLPFPNCGRHLYYCHDIVKLTLRDIVFYLS